MGALAQWWPAARVQRTSLERPDWRDAGAYSALAGADRSLFAWEWLRRDPAYAAAAMLALRGGRAVPPRHFGLEAYEDPRLPVPEARPMWGVAVHPAVLAAEAGAPGDDKDLIEPGRFAGLATIVRSRRADHLLLSDGWRAIRVDFGAGALAGGALFPRFRIDGIASAEPPLLTFRRLLALCRTGTFQPGLHRRERRASRWVQQLRAHDADAAGISQRGIAEILFRRELAEPGWRVREPSIRAQVQRLVRSARTMGGGAWRQFLR